MPKTTAKKIAYTGYDALFEKLVPEPSEAELRQERLEAEIQLLRDENRHLRQAMHSAGLLLSPYCNRLKLNGGSNDGCA